MYGQMQSIKLAAKEKAAREELRSVKKKRRSPRAR
jgi:hypothetical protein